MGIAKQWLMTMLYSLYTGEGLPRPHQAGTGWIAWLTRTLTFYLLPFTTLYWVRSASSAHSGQRRSTVDHSHSTHCSHYVHFLARPHDSDDPEQPDFNVERALEDDVPDGGQRSGRLGLLAHCSARRCRTDDGSLPPGFNVCKVCAML